MKKSIIIYILIFCLFSCQNKKPKYYYLSYNNTITDVIIDGGLKDSLETGKWAFYDQKKVLLSNGTYNKGLKEGEWVYLLHSANVNVDWSIFLNDTVKFAINYPSEWKITTDREYLFRATFNKVDSLKGKYLIVSKITNDTVTIRADEYGKQVISLISKHFTINNRTSLILKNNNREVYFNKLDIIRDGKNFAMYEACTEINNNLYDFMYSTDDLTDLPGVIFFNILQGCFIDSTRIVNPLYPYTFEKI